MVVRPHPEMGERHLDMLQLRTWSVDKPQRIWQALSLRGG